MANLELQTGYIADAIIDVKSEKFGERFVSIKELLTIKKIVELRLKEKQLRVSFVDTFFSNYFRVDNDVITKTDGETLKMYIRDERIRQIIYDDELIYYCLCKILISKLNNSMEHICGTCYRECEDSPTIAAKNTCCDREHNFGSDFSGIFSMEEQQILEDGQSQEVSNRKNIKQNVKQ